MWEYSPKTIKIRIFPTNLPLRDYSFAQFFYEIVSVCRRLQVDFKFLIWSLSGDNQPSYKHFPAVGVFSHEFSIAPSGETTDHFKKSSGCKNGMDLLYHYAKYGGDRGSRAGCRRKSVMLLLCFLCHGFTRGKFLQKNYHFGRFLGPQGHIFKAIAVKFGMRAWSCGSLPQARYCKNRLRGQPLLGKFIPKITNFSDFGGCKPTF